MSVLQLDSPQAAALTLETLAGRKKARLLAAARERFRGQLFQALLDRAREHLAGATPDKADNSLDLAWRLLRYSANDQAKARGFFAIAIVWHDGGYLQQAMAIYHRAALLFRRTNDASGELRVQARWAQAQTAAGQLRAAIRRYHRAHRLAEANGEMRTAAQIVNNLGNVYLKAGDYSRAYKAFTAAVTHAIALDYPELLCLARGNMGLAAFELGRFTEAETALRAAAVLAQGLGDRYHEGSYRGSLGNALRALGRLHEAEACFRQALRLAREISNQKSEELALGNLGILLFQIGRMNEAIASLESARTLSLSLAEIQHAAHDAYHLGVAYREIGDDLAAATSFQECLRLAEQARDVAAQTGALEALAYLAMSRNDWPEAAAYLRLAEFPNLQEVDTYNAASLLMVWGHWYYQQGQYEQAAGQWRKAITLNEESNNPFSALTASLNYGGALVMNGRYTEASHILKTALQQAQAMAMPDEERVIWEGLGLVNELQGHTTKAQTCYENGIAVVEVGRGDLTSENHRIGFFGIRQGVYVRLVQLLRRQGQTVAAWTVVERARARSFVDALARTSFPGSGPEELAMREQELLALLRLRQEEAVRGDGRQLPTLLAELAQLREQLDLVWQEMAAADPEYVALRRSEPLSWVRLRDVLAV